MQILQWCKRCGSFQHSFIRSFIYSFCCMLQTSGWFFAIEEPHVTEPKWCFTNPITTWHWKVSVFYFESEAKCGLSGLIHLDDPKNYTPTVKFYFWATSELMTSVCPEFRHRFQKWLLYSTSCIIRIIIVVWVKVLDSGWAVFTGSCNSKQTQQVRFTLVHIPERFVKMFGM